MRSQTPHNGGTYRCTPASAGLLPSARKNRRTARTPRHTLQVRVWRSESRIIRLAPSGRSRRSRATFDCGSLPRGCHLTEGSRSPFPDRYDGSQDSSECTAASPGSSPIRHADASSLFSSCLCTVLITHVCCHSWYTIGSSMALHDESSKGWDIPQKFSADAHLVCRAFVKR